MDRYTVFAEKRAGDFELLAELSRREKEVKVNYAGLFPFNAEYDSTVTQFSPRLRHSFGKTEIANEFIFGMDFSHWERDTRSNSSFGNSADHASQKSYALYVRDEIRIKNLRLAAGARTEKFSKNYGDSFGTGYKKEQSVSAWDLQGNYAVSKHLDVFAKVGRSYRIPNADENGLRFTLDLLEPQVSRDLELGTAIGNADHRVAVRLFQHRIKDEIFYDPTLPFGGANTNLDDTRREGIEIEARTRLSHAFALSGIWQHVSAKFTDGLNNGNEMILVPENIATLRLNWAPGNGHNADVGVQWVDSQRYGDDFTNTCSSRIPSFTTMDARYAFRTGAWEFAIAGSNLTDTHYYSSAFSCRGGIYPEPGRQVKLSVRYDF
jgi:iron complex outermembrane receptor protein